MTFVKFALIFVSLTIGGFLFLPNVYADQPPPLVASIQNSPYYFAEDDLGINMLRYFNVPLTPYLTEGVTDKSTNKEIMDAYYKTNSNITSSVVEQHSDRAISYVLHIESPEIFGKDDSDNKVASFNFQLFNPETNAYQFTLESLSSKDKQKYYELASRYINPGKRPDPFDATIDVVTGDGTVLQKWQYYDCSIAYFETYLQNNLTFLMFAGGLEPEIRDHSQFECRARYMQADMEHIRSPYTNFHGTTATKTYDTAKLGKIPSTDDRALSYLVSFVGKEIPKEVTFQTFQQFGPLGQTIPQYYGYLGFVGTNPEFFLESLLSKDKKGYYEYISRYINAGKTPDQFDVKVDLVSPDSLKLKDDMKKYMTKHGIKFRESDSMLGFSKEADAVYMTRIQDEYDNEFSAGNIDYSAYTLTQDVIASLKPNCIVMHPLPRREEIPVSFDADPRSRYWEQVENGMWARVALIAHILECDLKIKSA